jgi:peptidoglycan/LPS O-acetylase OafA/YrhL
VIAPAWSLAVEAVFYVALPLFGWMTFAASRRLSTRAARYGLQLGFIATWFALGLADKLYWMLVRHAPARDVFTYFQFLPKAHLFAFGMLLALWHARDRAASPLRGARPWIAPVIGVVIVVAAAVARESTFTTAVMFDTLTGFGFFLIVSAVAFDGDAHTHLSRALHWRPIVWAGVVSYSLYLLHERLLRLMVRRGMVKAAPAWVLPDLIAVVAVSLFASWLLYRFVEKPFLALRKRWS